MSHSIGTTRKLTVSALGTVLITATALGLSASHAALKGADPTWGFRQGIAVVLTTDDDTHWGSAPADNRVTLADTHWGSAPADTPADTDDTHWGSTPPNPPAPSGSVQT